MLRNEEGFTQVTAPGYKPHTVEILYTTAALLVLCVTVYLIFFDNWSAF